MRARRALPPLDLDLLPSMSLAALRELWTERHSRVRMPAQPALLVRELAWRAQEAVHGGLDAATKQALERAVAAVTRDRKAGRKSPLPPRPALGALPARSKLVRLWNGVEHEVEVLDGGRTFIYRGEVYGSLSKVAKVISGVNRSGPLFFGLTTRRRGARSDELPQRRKPKR